MLAAQLEKHTFALELSNDSLFCSVDFHMFELSKKTINTLTVWSE